MAKLIHVFYLILLIEYFVGGGGSFLKFGSLSFRTIIHSLCLLISIPAALHLSKKSKRNHVSVILCLWILLNIISLNIGFLNPNFNMQQAFIDVKGQLVFLLMPFLTYASNNPFWKFEKIISLLCFSALINAIMQITLTAVLFLGLIDFNNIWSYFYENNELVFRNFPFIQFKNHFLSLLALPFIIVNKPRYYKLYVIIISISIFSTLSRASIFFLILNLFGLYFIKRTSTNGLFIKFSLTLFVVVVILCYGQNVYDFYLSQRDFYSSNQTRLSDTGYVFQNANPFSFIFGNGTGTLINGRVNIENSYLWIFYKYGIIGLFLWGLFLYYSLKKVVIKMKKMNYGHYVKAFIFSFVTLILYSFLNPYINNTIGLFYILIFLTIQLKNHKAHED